MFKGIAALINGLTSLSLKGVYRRVLICGSHGSASLDFSQYAPLAVSPKEQCPTAVQPKSPERKRGQQVVLHTDNTGVVRHGKV